MPTSVQSSTWHNSTDSDFRTWGKAVSDGIAAVGLVKVADTGAIDWSTVVRGSTTASWGYEIWRFDDALQATHPVFLKIEYGGSNGSSPSSSHPQLWVTICRGTDGAGGPLNTLAPRRACHSYGSNVTINAAAQSIEPIFVSSDGSSLCVSPRTSVVSSAAHAPAFVVDRSRDAAGAPTAAGGVILTEGQGGPAVLNSSEPPAQLHAWTYAGDSWMGDVPAVSPTSVNGVNTSSATSLAAGDKAPVFPYVVTVPNHVPWQVLAAVCVMAGDAANGPFTANVLGRIRNYRSIPVSEAHCRWMSGARANGYSGLCILWEE